MKRVAGLCLVACLSMLAGCGDDASSKGSDAGGDAAVNGHDAGDKPDKDGSTSNPKDSGSPSDKDAATATDGSVLTPGEDGGDTSDDSGSPAADGGNGSDAATGSNPFGAGPYSLTYAGEGPGVDIRPAVNAVVDANGTLESYQAILAGGGPSSQEAPTIGDLTASERFVDDVAAVGRWNDGTMGGKFYASLPAFGPKEGFHYAIGQQDTVIPASGSATYALLASTKPTIQGGGTALGSVSAASAKVVFSGATSKVAIEITVSFGAQAYELATAGGVADPSTSELSVSFKNSFGGRVTGVDKMGPACTGALGECRVQLDGVLLGEDEERLAVSFSIGADVDTGKGAHGVVLLDKQ